MIKQLYLDDLKLHDIEDPTCPFFIAPNIKGLEFPTLRVGSHNRAGQDGIALTSIYLGERRMQFIGTVFDSVDPSMHAELRRSLVSVLKPIRDTNSILVTRTLRFTTIDGQEYRLLVQVVKGDVPMELNHHSEFVLDLLATSSVVESLSEKTAVINTSTRGGFVLPVVLPIVFSAGTGGQALLTNDGDDIAYPVITLDGPLTNPRLTNVTTGDFIALTLTIATGETVEIDMNPNAHTIMQGGTTNRYSSKSAGDFFGLAPGNNMIKLATGISGEAGTATFKWRDAFVGV